MSFRLSSTLQRSKTLIIFIENAFIWKRCQEWRPIVLVWTPTTEALENRLTSFTSRESRVRLFVAYADDCCSVVERFSVDSSVLVWTEKTLRKRTVSTENGWGNVLLGNLMTVDKVDQPKQLRQVFFFLICDVPDERVSQWIVTKRIFSDVIII